MNKYIKNISIALLAGIFLNVTAQQDSEAKAILDNLSEKTKTHSTIKTSFSYTYEDKKNDTRVSKEGKITLKGDKYKLHFMQSVIYSDGTTIWSYSPEYKEVNITSANNNEEEISFLENPQKLLYIYNEEYKYRLVREFIENNVPLVEIDLYPKNLENHYSRITLIVNKSEYQVKSASIFGKNGENHLFYFKDFTFNEPVDDSFFIFNKDEHPGVEMIDLRL
jgi:outer membrane lipoprotein carrier protein